MNKTFFTVPMIVLVILLVCSVTALAHEGEDHEKKVYEEGSYGSSMGTGHEYGGHESGGHDYKGDHGGNPAKHSKEYYDKKYGKYDHEKKEMYKEGSGMNDDSHRMKEKIEHQRYEEGSR